MKIYVLLPITPDPADIEATVAGPDDVDVESIRAEYCAEVGFEREKITTRGLVDWLVKERGFQEIEFEIIDTDITDAQISTWRAAQGLEELPQEAAAE